MKLQLRILVATTLVACALPRLTAQNTTGVLPEWPAITSETKPWTRWWWPGSIVSKAGITENLEAIAKAGLGGVELTPIYGVHGYEPFFIPYLSQAWIEACRYTVQEAQRFGLRMDMATGTGWPFGGGRQIDARDAAKYAAFKTFTLQGGQQLAEPVVFIQPTILRMVGNQVYEIHDILKEPGREPEGTMQDPLLRRDVSQMTIDKLVEPIFDNTDLQSLALDQVRFPKPLPLQTLMAFSNDGQKINLTARVGAEGKLDWTAPPGQWTLYAVFQGWHGKMVERAAPGAEGNVIDHFSASALRTYLAKFQQLLPLGNAARAQFNDSYEVDDATGQGDWTPEFFTEFQARRGYDLRDELPALLGRETRDKNARVLMDYRETVSDLLLDNFTKPWTNWAHAYGMLTRNQAHGSPGNILDLYAATDIPETEGADIQRIKWATSAAHVAGKRLVSAEAATWLKDHFQANLADVRQNVDRYFLGGVNHVVYHGTCYSPPEEGWPGFLFYASVEFNPRNPFWTDFGALNRYVARVQSFLQSGQPDNNVLLYFPFADMNAAPVTTAAAGEGMPDLLLHFGAGGRQGTASFAAAAEFMQARGYGYDYVSDRQLQEVKPASEGKLLTGGALYQVIVVPSCEYIPLTTAEQLVALANDGATVIFVGALPRATAGLSTDPRTWERFRELFAGFATATAPRPGVSEVGKGKGRFLLGRELGPMLDYAKVTRETMADRGLQFTRRTSAGGKSYFIANWSVAPVDAWVPLATEAKAAALYNPMSDARGYAAARKTETGCEVYLQLLPGETCIVQTLAEVPANPAPYAYYIESNVALPLDGNWALSFVEGGPTFPEEVKFAELASWTNLEGNEYKIFSGTAKYSLTFPRPPARVPAYRLDLGQVRESARVRLNGQDLETLIGPNFELVIPGSLLRNSNTLEVFVSNSMANRIIDLDKRNVPWKKFYNVNFPASRAENRNEHGLFHADHWDPVPSGLLGPVTLTPLALLRP